MTAVHVTGDVHGHAEKLRDLLHRAELIDSAGTWTGADSTLWFMGDLVDHGPDGIGAIDLAMHLQKQAARTGGRVGILIGNHDLLLLAAYRFGDERFPGSGETFRDIWEESGGEPADLAGMTPDLARWFMDLPAMAREGDHLLMHPDALLYAGYGSSIDEVNRTVAQLLRSEDTIRWGRLLEGFEEHNAFSDPTNGTARAEAFLSGFGGEQIVHGHTPISKMTGQPAEAVRAPLLYASERCLDVDAGMYLGGPGFVCRLPSRL